MAKLEIGMICCWYRDKSCGNLAHGLPVHWRESARTCMSFLQIVFVIEKTHFLEISSTLSARKLDLLTYIGLRISDMGIIFT